jgi:Ribbon-helix-helix protein, copG family
MIGDGHGWITTRLTLDEKRDLAVLSAKRGMTHNEVIRRLIRHELEKARKRGEI